MAWIELHQTLPKHRKTMRFKRELGIDAPQAVGHLCFLWLWAIDGAPDGDLSQIAVEDIAEVCEWKGNPQDLMNALISSGFVTESFCLNDWEDYAGRLKAQREMRKEQGKERQRKYREKQKEDVTQNVTQSNALRNALRNAPVTQCNAPTIPYHTQPYPTVPNLYDVVVKGEKIFKVDKEERTKVCMESMWGKEPSPFEVSRAIKLIEGLNEEVTPEAIKLFEIALKVCSERDACNVAFLTGIYNNFRDRGIKTVKDYYDYEQGGRHEG